MVEQRSRLVIAETSDKLGTAAAFKIAEASRIDHLIIEGDAGDMSAINGDRVGLQECRVGQ